MQIKIKRIGNGKIPKYKTIGSVGADCYARIDKDVVIAAGKSATIPLGFAVEIPEGYELQIRGRSGLAHTFAVEGFTGTIDQDYRGEVSAILFNKSETAFVIKNEDRIAQAVVAPIIKAEWIEVAELSETDRGKGGFGSTGVSDKEKFYEPFKSADVETVKKLIGKKVIIDSCIDGTLANIFASKEIIKSYFIDINIDKGQDFFGLDFADFSFVEAFQRVTIDGHRFGKEIEYDEKTV